MSKARGEHAGGMFDRPGRLLSGAACVVFFFWYAFTASHKLHELLVGVGTTALTVWFFAQMLRTEKLNIELRLQDVAQCWRLPKEIAHDCWVITAVLFKDLFGVERAGSFYRACGFQTSRRDPVLMGRTALAVAYTTASPNMLVIGVDPAQSLMLFHQLQRDKVSEMTRHLGAHP